MGIKKTLTLTVEFPDNFTPPEKFEDPSLDKDYNTKCDFCPFFIWEKEVGYSCCIALGDDPKTLVCPIRKQF